MSLYVGPQRHILSTGIDATDSAGQAVRYWLPPDKTPSPLIIWCHPQGNTQSIGPTYFSYPLIHALLQEGYSVIASAAHGADSWTTTAAVTDVENSHAFINPLRPVTDTILVGYSMGASLAAQVAKDRALPDLRGLYLGDAAVNLAWMYSHGYSNSIMTGYGLTATTLSAAAAAAGATSISTAASIPSGTAITIDPDGTNPETVTTTGAPTGSGPYTIPVPALGYAHASGAKVSAAFASLPAGRNPAAFASSDLPTGLRWRSTASTSDTTVDKTNNIGVFRSIIDGASPAEESYFDHLGGHISASGAWPQDLVAFVKRCLA